MDASSAQLDGVVVGPLAGVLDDVDEHGLEPGRSGRDDEIGGHVHDDAGAREAAGHLIQDAVGQAIEGDGIEGGPGHGGGGGAGRHEEGASPPRTGGGCARGPGP